MNTLTEMKNRFDDGFNISDRAFVEKQYALLLGKKILRNGCGDCYRDAYIEIFTYLKRLGKMPDKSNYALKSGVVVHPAGTNKFYAHHNIPDAVAEKYLAEFPDNIREFEVYPVDYLARVKARKSGMVVDEKSSAELAAELQKVKDELTAVKKEKMFLEKKIASLQAMTPKADETKPAKVEREKPYNS